MLRERTYFVLYQRIKMSLMYRRKLTSVTSYLTENKTPTSSPDQTTQQSNDFIPFRGAIFDMDGTLTKPVLNFTEMRQAVGVPPSQDILVYIHSLPSEEERREAFRKIEEIEDEANKKMELQPGVLELLEFLAAKNIKRALLTRNTSHTAELFISKLRQNLTPSSYPHLSSSSEIFSKVLSRDFKPHKPHPAPVTHICTHWSLPPKHVIVIGDDKVDVISGHKAGTVTVLLANKPQEGVSTCQPDSATPYDVIIKSLPELIEILQKPLTIATKNNTN